MEVAGGSQRKLTVCLCELAGTALFIFNIIVSNGNASAVPIALFASIILFGAVTGGHFNPAVTIGVYVNQGKWKENLGFALLIMFSQVLGAFLSVGMAILAISAKVDGEYVIPDDRVPVLAPKAVDGDGVDKEGSAVWEVLFTQIVLTFIFVAVILTIKTAATTPSKDGVLQALTVVLTLAGLIMVATHTAACFNPAVAVALTHFQTSRLDNSTGYLSDYFTGYFFGPLLGGILAGFFSMLQESLVTTPPKGLPESRDDEAEPLKAE